MNPLFLLFNGVRDFSLIADGVLVPAFFADLLELELFGDGVMGVELVGLDVDNASFQIGLDGTVDTIVVDGIGSTIAGLETDVLDITNDEAEFVIFDLSTDAAQTLGDGTVLTADNVSGLLSDVLAGTAAGFDLVGLDQDNITLEITTGGATDTLVIDQAQDAIAEVAQSNLSLSNAANEISVLDASEATEIFVGDSTTVSEAFAALVTSGTDFAPSFDFALLNTDEALAIVEALVLGDGVDDVTLLNIDDDTATIAVGGNSDDIIVFDGFDFSVLTDAPMA